jgi:hypothetical protein
MMTFSPSRIETTLSIPHWDWLVSYTAMLPLTVNKRFDPFDICGVAPQKPKNSAQ